MIIKFTLSVMILEVVNNEGHITFTTSSCRGSRLMAASQFWTWWMSFKSRGWLCMSQQVSASSHLIAGCHGTTTKMKLPSFSDLNTLQYYIWSIIERESKKWLHNTKDSLKANIVDIKNENHLIWAVVSKATLKQSSKLEALLLNNQFCF